MGKMNKKGVSDELLHVLMEIAIIALVILLFFYIAAKLWGGGADDNTLSFFNALSDNVQLMMDRQTDFEYQTMIFYNNYQGGEGMYYVVGFTSNADLNAYRGRNILLFSPPCPTYGASGFNAEDLTDIEYPDQCNNNPCLCLYKGLKNTFPAKPIRCNSFSNQVVFHGYFVIPEDNYYVKQQINSKSFSTFAQDPSLYNDYSEELKLDYKQLMFGAACDSITQDLYIEKYRTGVRTHILITPYLSGDQIRSRTALLSTCPDNSDAACNGALYNTNVGSGFCYFDENQEKCVFRPGVSACAEGQELTDSCFCGSTFIDKKNDPVKWRYAYCYNINGRFFASQFDCNKIITCKDYCKTISDMSEDCAGDEIDYCITNPCGSLRGLSCAIGSIGTGSLKTCNPS